MVSTERLAALSDAYKECQQLAKQHPENFPVASWLLPRQLRPHVAAIYTFARTADDFADEPGREPNGRLQLLDEWGRRLRATEMESDARASAPAAASIFAALAHTRRQFNLPIELFEDLLSAFRQDVTTTRYETWDDVFDYCRRSANPVGRLVLRLFGYDSPELDRYSDAVCTALQLTNFWQDFMIDWTRGRLYLPAEEWKSIGASTSDLDAGRITPLWQAALAKAAVRTRKLFQEGRPIADRVHGRLRYELRATWLGGMRILDRVERVQFDVANHRPTLRLPDGLVIAWRTASWRS
jgi:squalene synthase HpnC